MNTVTKHLTYLLVVAMVLIGIMIFYVMHHESGDSRVVFQLQSATGEPYTERELWGHWSMVTFGFTHCPDICPQHVSQISNALTLLEEQMTGAQPLTPVQAVFIGVDHVRDDAESVHQYLSYFHEAYKGVIGSQAQLDLATDSFGTSYSVVQKEDDVEVVHSSLIYIVDPFGRIQKRLPVSVSAPEIANEIISLL